MRVAIVGAGISGLNVAYRLRNTHDVQVFEAAAHIGGHTHTHDVTRHGATWRIDTGFIVYNDRTYPHFIALLDELGVASQPTQMSFSVRHAGTGLEYTMPNDIVSFVLDYSYAARDSNFNGLDYNANEISAGVRASF